MAKPVTFGRFQNWSIVMTARKYKSLCESYSGICLACGAIRKGDTEPDAENYHCKKCKLNKVQGIENALVAGNIEIK